MSGFIYVWFDRKHRRYYVGKHWGAEDDGYVCSSNWMKQAYKKRPQDFRRKIVARVTTSRKDLTLEEERWLQMIKPEELKVRYYNLTRGHMGQWHDDPNRRLTVGQKISAAHKGKKYRQYGPVSEETKEKLRAALKGKKKPPRSEEHRKKISENSRRLQAEGRIGMHGKKHKESTLAIMREKNLGENNPFFGRHHTPEARARIGGDNV